MTAVATDRSVRAASLEELRAKGRLVVHLDRHTLCLFAEGEEVYAVDNRCPHMGFPLHRGTVCDGILTCHWHHARFDLATGGTFDQFADELRRFPVDSERGRRARRPEPARGSGRSSAQAAGRRAGARHPARAGEGDDRPARSRCERPRPVPGGDRLRRPSPRRGVVPRADDDHLPDEPRSTPRRARARRGPLPRPLRRRVRLGDGAAALPPRPAAGRAARAGTAGRVVPQLHRSARRGGRRACARLRRPCRRDAERARGHAFRRCHRPPLPRRRPHARFREQGARSAGRRRLGARRAGARVAPRAARLRRADGGVERVAQPGRPPRTARGRIPAAAGGAGPGSRPARKLEWPRRARDGAARRRGSGAGREAARRAPRRSDRGRARVCGLVRRRDAHRPLPDEQRLQRLGHRASHVHVRQRRRAGTAPLALARARCAASSTAPPACTSTAS